jgi:hypothetical protein
MPPPAIGEGAGEARQDTTPGPPVSPLGALGRSILIPGWGQAAVDRPVRGAFYFAAEAAAVWMIVKSQAKLSSARRGLPPDAATADSALVESRNSQRENWIVLGVFVALVSGVDAWVSAHLFGFEGELTPPEDGTAGAAVKFSVPVGSP